MIRLLRWLIGPTAAVALIAATLMAGGPAPAQDLSPNAFYGRFQGSGVAENADSLYFGVTVRDLDVQIGPEGNGFYVEWTSVIRGGGNPNDPDIRRRTQRMVFTPTGRPGVFDAVGRQDPRGDGLAWANIAGRTMSVHVMRITDAGGYVVQSYNRTLEGTGMKLKFINIADGDPRREVEARLVKVGN